jgi:PQQ-dependent catabolism-associated CXXCW motif protein
MRMSEAIDALGEPYPGLRSFRRDETHIFFGREGSISEMVDRLAAHHFLAVTGISGSGKSSLVRTGLLDALDRGLLVEAGSNWRVADFRPGRQPLTRLTEALAAALDKSFSDQELGLIEAKLASGPMGLVAWLDEINFPADTNILLFVDQFEEIFRYRQGQSGDDINAFVALFLASAKQRKRRIYVVITMRSDFLGDCAQFTDLAETINDGQFLTPRLTREQCEQAIEGPAAVYGGRVEPALVTRMLNDMGGNPDQLPLMQHILMLLWEKAKARSSSDPELTLDDYKELGGIGVSGTKADELTATYGMRPSLLRRMFRRKPAAAAESKDIPSINGALSDHADRVLAGLTGEQQRLTEILFRALTQGEGEGGRDVRRPVSLAKAAAIAQVPVGDLMPIIKAFGAPGRNFLVPPEPDPRAADKTMIDISHESLIRQWVRLRRWVRDEYQSAETYRHIERSAKQWKIGLGNLMMKLDLAVARRWHRAERPNAAWAERYGDAFDFAMAFLRKSERHRLWRRGIAAVAAVLVVAVVLSTATAAMYAMTMMVAGLSYINPADEWSNFGVNPQSELKREVGTNTPLSIPGGRVIGTRELESALNRGTLEGVPFLTVDAWRRSDSEQVYIPGSKYIGYAGDYGTFDDGIQRRLKEELAKLTKDNLDMPLVFFCIGAKCWESYNAALRAIKLGYRKVYWYRGGIGAWQAAHRPYPNPTEISRIPVTWSGMIVTVQTITQMALPDPDYHYKRGLDYGTKGQHDYAVADFSEAIQRNPAHVDAYYHRALAHAKNRDYAASLDDLLKVIELAPMRTAEIQARIHDPEYAAKYAQGYTALGNRYYSNNDYDRAIEQYDRSIELDPDYAMAYANRGFVYGSKGDYDNAIKDFDQAIMLAPKLAVAHANRGDAFYYKGDYDAAIRDHEKAIELGFDKATSFGHLGRAYFAKHDFERAIQEYDKMIALQPNNANALRARAQAEIYAERISPAIADLTAALKLEASNAYDAIWLHIARVRAGLVNLEELAANTEKIDRTAWPWPLVALFLGASAPETVHPAARSFGAESNRDDQVCEADFYLGFHRLANGQRAEAKRLFEAVVTTCPRRNEEYQLGRVEFERLR